jgi:two-component system, OmpR family, KDP operon response regulator KdpE
MSVKKNTILIADADQQTKKMLDIIFDQEKFCIEWCGSGREVMQLSISLKPDLILLDLNLPDIEGNLVISSLREWTNVPIVILTLRKESSDIVKALDLGADDYVIKPFNMGVLQSRINASLRKSIVRDSGSPELVNGALRIDLVRHEVYLRGEIVPLTPKEYNLLRYFMVNCGKMLTHKEILSEVWGGAQSENTQYLRVFIGQIRKKIDTDALGAAFIVTEPGIGYRMDLSVENFIS